MPSGGNVSKPPFFSMETENSPGKPRRRKGIVGSLVLIGLLVCVIVLSGLTTLNYVGHQTTNVSKSQTQSLSSMSNVMPIGTSSKLNEAINLPGFPVNVSLSIKVFDPNGTMVKDLIYPNDLILNNFVAWWAIMTLGTTESMTTDGNSAGNVGDTMYATDTTGAGNFYTFGSVVVGAGGYIGIGTGSTSPARTDYKLQTQVGSYSAVDSAIYIQGAQSITFASGFTLTSGATISEAGYFTKTVAPSYYMLFHDTFTGFAVSADQSVQIQYTLNLPALTMVNLAVYLAAALQNCLASSESATCYNEYTMTTTSGSIVTAGSLAMFGMFECGYQCYCASLGCLASDYFLVGTGSVVTVTDYTLDARVGPTTTSETTTLDLINHLVLAVATIPLTTGYTISESGLYVTSTVAMGTSPGNYQFMFVHNSFSGVAIAASASITVQDTYGF